MEIYHGSDHVVKEPKFGYGKPDNDYGSGFYCTEDEDKADDWAIANGKEKAICNKYELDLKGLNVLYFDRCGPLAWIAEILYNRGTRTELSEPMANKIIEKYKIDTSTYDVIIGYRADDSYIDIVDAFLINQLTLDEVVHYFKEGQLGEQVFIKSEKAFSKITFVGEKEVVKEKANTNEINARIKVSKFLSKRNEDILINGFVPSGIKAIDAIKLDLVYNAEYSFYHPKGNAPGGDSR